MYVSLALQPAQRPGPAQRNPRRAGSGAGPARLRAAAGYGAGPVFSRKSTKISMMKVTNGELTSKADRADLNTCVI